jgi:class 3 adenylate cyclase
MSEAMLASRWLATPDGSVTIMFTDLCGSTELLARIGEPEWLQTLRDHNALVHERVKQHGGAEVKFLGDGWMVVFASPLDALRCAVELQIALHAYAQQHPDRALQVRVGVHTGEAVKEGADFLGKDVVVASRLSDAAGPGEILASGTVRCAAGANGQGPRFDAGRVVELRGLGLQRAFAVSWEPAATGAGRR